MQCVFVRNTVALLQVFRAASQFKLDNGLLLRTGWLPLNGAYYYDKTLRTLPNVILQRHI